MAIITRSREKGLRGLDFFIVLTTLSKDVFEKRIKKSTKIIIQQLPYKAAQVFTAATNRLISSAELYTDGVTRTQPSLPNVRATVNILCSLYR